MSDILGFLNDIIAGELDIYVITFTLVVTMIVLLFLSFPMVVPLAVAALVGLVHFSDIDTGVIIQQIVTGISPNALIAVPMFILAADIMARGHTANNLLGLIEAFFGHRRGGLPITACLSCTLFGSVSGSTQATVVSVGQIMRPKLLTAGYKDSFVMALIINASDIAFLIPPSIGLILYGTLANTSVGELFIAGIGPGYCIGNPVFGLLLRLQPCSGGTRLHWSSGSRALNAWLRSKRRFCRWAFRPLSSVASIQVLSRQPRPLPFQSCMP